jgi:hypothetical protein
MVNVRKNQEPNAKNQSSKRKNQDPSSKNQPLEFGSWYLVLPPRGFLVLGSWKLVLSRGGDGPFYLPSPDANQIKVALEPGRLAISDQIQNLSIRWFKHWSVQNACFL